LCCVHLFCGGSEGGHLTLRLSTQEYTLVSGNQMLGWEKGRRYHKKGGGISNKTIQGVEE